MSIIAARKTKNKEKIKKEKRTSQAKMLLMGGAITIGFMAVIVKLSYVTFVKGADYKQAAYAQQTTSQMISPNRGTIYDKNGEVLAVSVSVDTVSINPAKIKYASGKKVEPEKLAEKFSELFGISYEDALAKVQSEKTVEMVARKVENTQISALKEWMTKENITAGINIDEDYKRYYPNGTLASTLLGFCGTDNSGRAGIEARLDSLLVGTAGKLTVTADVNGDAISDELEEYVAAENGSNIYLTIDSKIQQIAEKYLKEAVNSNGASYGGVILMNPQNGDIYGMANYPDYDLNNPQDPGPTGLGNKWGEISSEEQMNALYSLWANKNVSYLYEPGSTFKLLISAIGLEENYVETDTPGEFFCDGHWQVADKNIACWNTVNPHGHTSLRQALEGSCNPAFMQLGARIGVSTLYKYFDAFGLFSKIGTDIAAVPNSQFHEESKIAQVELATMSFGQRFEITPLQLITAVSAIANGGTLVEPKIISQIENTDTGSIKTIDTKTVRQVISPKTANEVKDMMLSVVKDGTGKHAAVQGFEVGGKSGTSEPPETRAEEGYTASFIAISPIENTQVVCLIMLHNLSADRYHQGGQTCGPVAAQILSEVLPYLEVTSGNVADSSQPVQAESTGAYVSNVTNITVAAAKEKLGANGFNVVVNVEDENASIVTDQMPKAGALLEKGATIYLYTKDNDVRTSVGVPDVKGKPMNEAIQTLKDNKLNVIVEGTKGIVVSQSITSEEVAEGTIVTIVVKEELKEGQ